MNFSLSGLDLKLLFMVTGTYYEMSIKEKEVDSDLETTINRLKKTNPLTGTLDEEGGFLMLSSRLFAKSKLPLPLLRSSISSH